MSTKLITPEAQLSYPHLHTPQQGKSGPPKYSCSLVFPAGADLSALRAAAIEAATAKFGATWKLPNKVIPIAEAMDKGFIRSPFRTDGESKGYDDGATFINVRTVQQPGIVHARAGQDGKPLRMSVDEVKAEMYPGAKVRASVSAFGYDTDGNKGVSFGLNNLQKVGEGERIDGRVSAENEFEVVASEVASLDDVLS